MNWLCTALDYCCWPLLWLLRQFYGVRCPICRTWGENAEGCEAFYCPKCNELFFQEHPGF